MAQLCKTPKGMLLAPAWLGPCSKLSKYESTCSATMLLVLPCHHTDSIHAGLQHTLHTTSCPAPHTDIPHRPIQHNTMSLPPHMYETMQTAALHMHHWGSLGFTGGCPAQYSTLLYTLVKPAQGWPCPGAVIETYIIAHGHVTLRRSPGLGSKFTGCHQR